MAVCERTYRQLLTSGPYRDAFIGITPSVPRAPVPWCAPPGTRRTPAETKGAAYTSACSSTGCC
jgi:arsenite methyltransferase